MKALDTPALLEILRGRPPAKALLRSLAGEELATTELNLYELDSLARIEGPRGLERRLTAIERLRRRLTTLPIDERATRAAAAVSRGHRRGNARELSLMLGAAVAAGCSEWITTRSLAPTEMPGHLKLRLVGQRATT